MHSEIVGEVQDWIYSLIKIKGRDEAFRICYEVFSDYDKLKEEEGEEE